MAGAPDSEMKSASVRWALVFGIAAAISAAVTIIALIFTLNAATRFRDTALDSQQRSYEVMILARSLDASIGQAEAFLGRFVISGDKDLGRIYFDDWRRAGTQLDALDKAIQDPKSQVLIDRLREAYNQRGDELAAVALRTNYKQNDAALSRYYQVGKARSLARIDRLLEAIIANERQTLVGRAGIAELAIDDADGLDPAHLLYALNAAAEAGQPVLLAARAPPGRWGTVLPDLASRLRATTAVGLGPADDAFLQHLLVRLLSDRQLTVPDTVQAWMLTALPRDPAVLRQAVLTLDRAALASGRAVTRPLATAVLGPLVRDSSDIITADASPEPAGLL